MAPDSRSHLCIAAYRKGACRPSGVAVIALFRPFGACPRFAFYPRLAPWAAFCRRFAAKHDESDGWPNLVVGKLVFGVLAKACQEPGGGFFGQVVDLMG
jgi:hypothetical protein